MGNFALSSDVQEAIHISQAIAREFAHQEYSSAHLLKALMHKKIGMLSFIESIGQDGYYVEEWAEVRLEAMPKTTKVPESPASDALVEATMVEADNIKFKLGLEEITPKCLLVALSTPGVGFSFEQLKTFPLTPKELMDNLAAGEAGKSGVNTKSQGPGESSGVKSAVDYCIDKTAQAQSGDYLRITGRDSELKMIIEILGRKSKPNVLIVGDPGVGKTAMMHELAFATISENAPDQLRDARVFELDFIDLVSGAGYKGEIEDRLKKVFVQLKSYPKVVLLIDELKNLSDKNSGNQGLVNILKSEMSKGEVTLIATATNDAFRKHVESDEGLARQFEIVRLNEPTEAVALRMIESNIGEYAEHHQLDIDDETISEAIRLARRYNKERALPDSAIDLIDRTMSAANFMIQTSEGEIDGLKEQLSNLKEDAQPEDQKLSELMWMATQMKDKLSYLLFADLGEEDHLENISTVKEGMDTLDSVLKKLTDLAKKEKNEVSKNDVAATIANKTGIPTGKLQADEKERLLTMEASLKKRVIGQDHACRIITEAVLESRSGLSKPGLPIGSFFFSGPTGTGKTELAKALAENLFQTETAITRFDMSEFKEEHSAALLYGAPPGYVGYEEGGLLVNKIREKPYSIVLFDEIEKAHPSVFDIFLQILDEGKLHDRLGKEGDFSNALILFTSNIGSDFIVDTFGKGEIPKSSELLEIMGKYFRPEFLGRLTEIIPFSPITQENVSKIFKIQLKDLYKALDKQDISLSISDEATDILAMKGFTPKYGARPLRGVIRSDLRSPLSKKLISGELLKGASVKLEADKNGEIVWSIKNP